MLKTLLVIPPKYGIDYPPLGTPALLGYLKSKGVEAEQVDWNMEYCLAFDSGDSGDINKNSPYKHLLPDKPASEMPYNDNTYSSFFFTERILSSPLLFQFINDSKENPFHRFILEKKLIDEIIQRKIRILGLSIISPSQVIFSFTLGYLLKQTGLKIHIVIGGQWVSLYKKEILKRNDLTAFFDSAIFFEGETPLFRLICELSNGGDLSNIPNLIYKPVPEGFNQGTASGFSLSESHSVEKLNDLPCPDFDGLPLNKYSTTSDGKVSLTFETSRECYWNKCVYCVDLPHPKQGYRVKNPSLVVRDIKNLLQKYPLKELIISDPAMSPNQMRGISREIIKEDLKIQWWCWTRLDKHWTKDIFELAKKAGCRTIDFGLETASQRLLDFMQKGINIDIAKRVLNDCYDAGLEIDLQMMLGLPTETKEEALETVTFLVENRKLIKHVTFNIYYLTPGCLIHGNPLPLISIILRRAALYMEILRNMALFLKTIFRHFNFS
ncbi:MAG: B12-binding domain-containing radical SAM protein [Deltaproteobacteria bacterium]|nr:B12-binding domain-containing radical SAM protein [Deltaproteobacteria bacterium]